MQINSVTHLHSLCAVAMENRDPAIIEEAMHVVSDWLCPPDERNALLAMLEGILVLIEETSTY